MTAPEGTSLREELERAILGELPELSAEDVAQAAEVPLADARRLWRALGFPDAGEQAAFTDADVKALAMIRHARTAGLEMDTIVRMTRAVGTTLSRLAEWEVANLVGAFEEETGASAPEERLLGSIRLVEEITPSFETLLLYAWRRHLAATVARTEVLQADDEVHAATGTVGFADIVGFTALTTRMDEHQLGDLVEVFESRCHDVVATHRGRVIKSLGDSVLFIADSAPQALEISLGIVGVIGDDPRLPDVRIGLATGPVVLRMGDVFGSPVNLAARLTTVARRNRVIIDHRTAGLLPVEDYETRRLPARPLRGFGDVEPIAVRAVHRR